MHLWDHLCRDWLTAAGMAFAAVYDASCEDWESLKSGADWVFGGR